MPRSKVCPRPISVPNFQPHVLLFYLQWSLIINSPIEHNGGSPACVFLKYDDRVCRWQPWVWCRKMMMCSSKYQSILRHN